MRSSEIIGWFADIGLVDRPTVGGKGGSLGELTRAKIPVPAGFVVKTAAFERFIAALEKDDPIRPKVEALGSQEIERNYKTLLNTLVMYKRPLRLFVWADLKQLVDDKHY